MASQPPSSTPQQRAVSPLPPQGPGAYFSYAYDELTTHWVPALVDALRQAGVRAVFDRDGIDVSGGSFEATIAALAPNLRAIIAVANRTYLARAAHPRSGVASDLKVFEDLLLLDPNAESKLLVLLDAEVNRDDLPPSLLTAPTLITPVGRDPAEPAILVAKILQTSPKPSPDLIPFDAAESRLHGVRDSEALRYIATWTDRSSSLLTPASLLAGLLHRESDQASERRLQGAERTPFVQRLLGLLSSWSSIGPERLGVTNAPLNTPPRITPPAFSALRWGSLLARSLGAPQTHPLHLLAALLVQHAPWRAEVDRLLTPLELSRDELAKVVVELAASGDPALGFTAQLMTRLRAALRVGPPTPAPSAPAPPKAAPKAPSKAPTKVAAVAPLEETLEAPFEQTRENAPAPKLETKDAEPSPQEAFADLAQTDRGLARLDPDSPSGLDRLNITGDVTALAKVLASWRLAPPLAVGLFGEWGSGKTFFMRKLRDQIGALSKSARDRTTTLQRDEAYCKHIAQVEFNAWHYSEGDLWAGMVHHIFSNLQIEAGDTRDTLAKRQQAALNALHAAEGVAADKAEQYRQSAQRAAQAEEAKTDAEARAAEAVSKLQISVRDAIAMLSKDEQMRALAGNALQRAGLTNDTQQAVKQVQTALEKARTEGGRLAGLVRRLREDFRDHPWRTVLLYAALFGAVPLASYLVSSSLVDSAGDLVRQAVRYAPSLLAVIGFLAAMMSRVSSVLDEPRRRLALEQQKRIDALQKEAEQRKAEANLARSESDQAVVQVSVARAEIQRLSPSHLLSEFLSERAGSKDYRDKLGLLATVRNDFDRLSELMLRQNRAEELAATPTELKNGELRLNRIILYIDDLDRCPPDRVVKVLQAIHLLLAFDLFVVVVGVDARWVQRSLRHQYKLMLRADGRTPDAPPDPSDEAPDDHDTIATPRDYLEKIFQVPFWLPTLSGADYADLIQALAQPQPPAEPAAQPPKPADTPAPNAPGNPSPLDPAASTANISANTNPASTPKNLPNAAPATPAPAAGGAPQPSAAPSSSPISPPPAQPQPAATTAGTPPTPPTPPPPPEVPERADVLHLDDREVTVMKDLADLYGRSPRAVKRFVNCYRLFKSMLSEHGRQPYLPATPAGFQPYELALLLLAVVVGSPSAARRLVDEVSRPANNAKTLRSLFKPPPTHAPEAALIEWRRLEPFLTRIPPALTAQQARDLVFRAWRFSFRSADADPAAQPASVAEPKPLPAPAPRGPAA